MDWNSMDTTHRNSMESIPLHRVAVVRPFAQFLADIGAPVARGFRQTGIPDGVLENINNYIPSHRFWAFLVNMARREGIEDLGFHVGQRCGADSSDPKLTRLLRRSPTLYQGLLQASDLTNRTISHCRLGILQPSQCDYAYFYHQPSCDADNPAIEQIGWFGLTSLIAMVRVFAGPQWQPKEIGIMMDHTPCRYIQEQFPGSRIRPLQPYSWITLENALLGLPPSPAEGATPAPAAHHYKPLSGDFAGTLEQVLLTYIQERNLNIEFAAGLCNMSKRSLQRKLMMMDTCYSKVRDQARFHSACSMLRTSHMQVTEVANCLGYSDVAHFSRAFRRIAGVSPRVYRQHHHTAH